MSNLPWRPPAAGGPATRNPPVIRLANFDGPRDQGQLLISAFAGRIRQYYHKQAQNFEAGQVEYSKTHVRYDDLAMTYANVGGQEIVTVEVNPEVVPRILSEKKGRQPDWLLAQFTYNIATAPEISDIEMYAIIRGFDGREWARAYPTTNVVPDPLSEARFIRFTRFNPGETIYQGYRTDTSYRFALLVDLRQLKVDPAQAITIDIHAATARTVPELAGYASAFDYRNPASVLSGTPGIYVGAGATGWRGTPGVHMNFFSGDWSQDYILIEDAPAAAPIPANTSSTEWVYREVDTDPVSGLQTRNLLSVISLHETGGNASGFPGAHPDWDMWEHWVEDFYTISPFYNDTYPVRPSSVRLDAAVFYGTPYWREYYGGVNSPSEDFYSQEYVIMPSMEDQPQSEDSEQFTYTREGLMTIGSPTDATIDQIDITDDMWRFGALSVTMENGGIGFKPA